MSAGFLQAIACPPSATDRDAHPFTLPAVGDRIAALGAMEEEPSAMLTSTRGRERLAPTTLGLLLPVRTLADAAVACDLAFGHADAVLESRVDDPGDYVRVLKDLRRVLAGVGIAVCAAAGLEASAVAWGGLGQDCAFKAAGLARRDTA